MLSYNRNNLFLCFYYRNDSSDQGEKQPKNQNNRTYFQKNFDSSHNTLLYNPDFTKRKYHFWKYLTVF